MAKKKSWFSLVKRLFVSESPSTSTQEKKKERRRRWVFGGYKIRKVPSLTAPPQKRLSEAEEEQNKHALNVVVATAAAAEAAVASAQATAEVVKLTESIHQVQAGVEKPSPTSPIHRPNHEQEREIQQFAATKIQTAYRGYLARKALRALKGIVKLQALIRGRAVRRQAVTTLKCLQSIVNIQTQACARRYQTVEGTDENKDWQVLGDKIIKVDSSSERRWDDSLLSKQNADALILSKKEAALKRERIKEYSFHHRKSAESERKKVNGRLRYWLEQWVDTQVSKSKELEDLDTMFNSTRTAEEFGGRKQLKLRSFQRKNPTEVMDSPVLASRRSSHHTRQVSAGEDNGSPLVIPTYMAATQSARAKARSVSSPKQRPGISETCSECYSPYKNKLSLVSSLISETPSNTRIIRHGGQQRSPSLKAVPGIIKSSSRIAKDLSFDSEYSFANLDRQY